MTRIATNVASLRGLRSLNSANKKLDTTLTRLSTGLKINSGKDNPAGLIASETLRSQITAIEQSIKNSTRANNVIATADAALGEITGLLNEIRGLVQEGVNDGALSQTEKEANQLQIDSALSAINKISSNTTFAGDKLIDGSKAFTTSVSAADSAKLSDFNINQALLGTSSSLAVAATVTTAAEQGELTYAGGALSSSTTIEVGGSSGQELIFLGANATNTDIAAAVNGVSDSTGVTASVDAGFTYTKAAVAATANFDLTGTSTDPDFTLTRVDAGNDTDLGGTVSFELIDPSGNNVAESVSVIDDGSGNKTIRVTSSTDGSGNLTSTVQSVTDLINNDTIASSLVSATAVAEPAVAVTAQTSTNLTGGLSEGNITFSDIRSGGSGLNIVIATSGTGSAATVAFDGTTATVTVGSATTLSSIETAVNGFAGLSNILSATVTGDGDQTGNVLASSALATDGGLLRLKTDGYGSAEQVSVNVLSGGFDTYNAAGTQTGTDAGVDIGVTINGQSASGTGLRTALRTSTLDVSLTFAAASNVASTNATVNITGGGSLFQIGEQVAGAGQIGVGIDAVNTARLGGLTGKLFELGTGNGKSLLDVGSGGVAGSSLVSIIEESIDKVTTLRGRLGSIQKNVIESNINTLGVALENITEARSTIVDADFAQETANLTKNQILSQSGISVLAIANQNPQQVLSLLG